jgi:hypothetical protein
VKHTDRFASVTIALLAVCAAPRCPAAGEAPVANGAPPANAAQLEFHASDRCVMCHDGMVSAKGEPFSIGSDWSISLMANSSHDPYWLASVRRETLDHRPAQAQIENECSACHLPIPNVEAKAAGRPAGIFAHVKATGFDSQVAADGVTCSVCHQISSERLGQADSYNGNFVITAPARGNVHPEYGPYDIAAGLKEVMRSSTGGLEPNRGDHIRSARLCATCHTLITTARDAEGRKTGSLNEQMPYPEWLHSDYRDRQTCQECHMPPVDGATPVARILAVARPDARHHLFVGANFLLQRMFGAFHDELNTVADPAAFADAADRTIRYLGSRAATLTLSAGRDGPGRVDAHVSVDNLGGHKLPTAYPSRRVWIHLTLYDRNHRVLFESGALNRDGSIVGNDNDADPARYEPHYARITRPDQVQIYEAILKDASGHVTTGLISAVDYLKDNRLLPHGFDKSSAPAEIAVRGAASSDDGFTGRGHRIEYLMETSGAPGPYRLVAELWYQPVGYRWAHNLAPYPASETQRFVTEFESMAAGSAVMLSSASAQID